MNLFLATQMWIVGLLFPPPSNDAAPGKSLKQTLQELDDTFADSLIEFGREIRQLKAYAKKFRAENDEKSARDCELLIQQLRGLQKTLRRTLGISDQMVYAAELTDEFRPILRHLALHR